MGLLAIGTNGLLYQYPEFGSVWAEWNKHLHPRVVTGSRNGVVYADEEGHVGTGNHGQVHNPEWTLDAPVTALATDADGRDLYAVANGHVSHLLPTGVVEGPCTKLSVVSLAIAQGGLWLSDGQRLYRAAESDCPPSPDAPPNITRLSGLGKRLFAVDQSGDVFRLQAGSPWEKLPRPQKYRPDQFPTLHPVQDVAVTGTAAWVVDDEANVFVFSEAE